MRDKIQIKSEEREFVPTRAAIFAALNGPSVVLRHCILSISSVEVMAAPTGFPVRTHSAAITLKNGFETSVFTSVYADRIMFIVTQVGTLGTMVQAQKETVLGGGTTFSTATLLGTRDDPLPELCARQLIEKLSQTGCNLPIILCLGLKRSPSGEDRDPSLQRELMSGVIDACLANPLW
jgi:proteasome assembly chaperone 3